MQQAEGYVAMIAVGMILIFLALILISTIYPAILIVLGFFRPSDSPDQPDQASDQPDQASDQPDQPDQPDQASDQPDPPDQPDRPGQA
jgi:predicted lipid-binding transport protein (Tim44 family)